MSYERTYLVDYAGPEGRNERVVCFDVRPEGERTIGLCAVGASTRRLLPLEVVRQASDFDTGEVLAGIEECFGEPPVPLTLKAIEVARSRDKTLWWKTYRLPVIENHFRNRLFALFDHRCFKCGRPAKLVEYETMKHVPFYRGLDRDHHVPIGLGGQLVPGNIVALCPSCNGKKHEADPRTFYSSDQLAVLRPLLARQSEILAFRFDTVRCHEDRRAYLLSVGIGEQLVNQVLHDEMHRYYVGTSSSGSFEITIGYSSP